MLCKQLFYTLSMPILDVRVFTASMEGPFSRQSGLRSWIPPRGFLGGLFYLGVQKFQSINQIPGLHFYWGWGDADDLNEVVKGTS